MKKVQYVVARSGENTFAIINADVTEFSTLWGNDFFKSLKKAVAKWQKTEAGKAAYKETFGDFNIGDLSLYLEDENSDHQYDDDLADTSHKISTFLAEEGIYNLEIQIFSGSEDGPDMTFDTHLMESEE